MNENTTRALLVAGLIANCIFLLLGMLDFSLWDSEYMWPIFVSWAFLVVLTVILALANSGLRVVKTQDSATPALARAVASLAARPAPAPAPAVPAKPLAEADGQLPFRYNGYTLYSRRVELKGEGGTRDIYFFAKSTPKSGHPAGKPAGYHVGVNERTGLPFLKKGSGQDGQDLTPTIEEAYRPQCAALTADGGQCRNSSRAGSKYCISHFGYQPPAIPKAAAARDDTRPAVRNAPDTKPAVRKRVTA